METGALGMPELFILTMGSVGMVLVAYVCGRIWSKAGYSGWAGILMIIPLVNLLATLFLAFARWPVEEELERLRNERAG